MIVAREECKVKSAKCKVNDQTACPRLGIMAEELAQVWAGARSARESLDVIKQRVTPMLALERA